MPAHASHPAAAEPRQHRLARSALLHLAPGVPVLAVYLLLGPVVMRLGFPPVMGLLLAIWFVLAPLLLGYLLYQGRRSTGRWTLAGVVFYRQPMPLWQHALLLPVLFLLAVMTFDAAADFEPLPADRFGWLPEWVRSPLPVTDADAYSGAVLLATFVVYLTVNGLIAPVVEELYFRGYLLPRIDRLGVLAPIVNVVLFSLYHLWSPWANLSRIVVTLPFVIVVWRKRNVYFGMLFHCLINTVGSLLVWTLVFEAA